jgi:hypothetical protein
MTTLNDNAERSASCSGSARHTPGPWRASKTRPFDVYSAEGRYIGTTKGNHALPEHIADEDKANARLIAAAPELLSMLKRIIRATDEGYDDAVWKLIELASETVSQAENG